MFLPKTWTPTQSHGQGFCSSDLQRAPWPSATSFNASSTPKTPAYIFAPWDLAPSCTSIRKYTCTCSKPRLPMCIIKFSARAPGQGTLAKTGLGLGRVVAGRGPGKLCGGVGGGGLASSLMPFELKSHLKSSPLICISSPEANCVFVVFLSFALHWRPSDPLRGIFPWLNSPHHSGIIGISPPEYGLPEASF